jgi:hypothetical protein
MVKIKYQRSADYVEKKVYTESGPNSPATFNRFSIFRYLILEITDGELLNDNKDAETVLIKTVSGLEISRGTGPANATVLDYDGDVTISVDGQKTTKTLTNGSVSFDLTTDKPAGSEIEVVAESLADHPAESDSATIEVVS